MSDEQQSSYRQIMKATSLFGGVQVFQILIQIIRSKFVALYLGPAGMGIVGLLTSTTGLIASITNFGLGTSAVKNIAEALGTNNENRIATIITVLRRLVWGTGALGAIITFALAPWLSKLTFGNTHYAFAFYWVSITLLINQISSGQMVLMQGLRKLQHLAKANLAGAFCSLLLTVPIYYYYGEQGIVPVIILTSVLTLAFSYYFSHKTKIDKIKVSKARTIAEGKDMLRMGFMISLSGLFALAASYIIRIFIANQGTVADVGLYNAGFAIISTYVGLVFSAMATDYYPRLSAVAADNVQATQTINQQAEIAILILAPILMVFLVFINWIIVLLYSEAFTAINGMIHWAALGMFFRAASWAIAFLFLAKGASKLFFWNELLANAYALVFNVLGYVFWGLNGLGIAFLFTYIAYLLQCFIIARRKYNFSYSKTFVRIFVILLALAILCFIFVRYLPTAYAYMAGMLCIAYSTWYSYKELDKRLDIKLIVKRILKK